MVGNAVSSKDGSASDAGAGGGTVRTVGLAAGFTAGLPVGRGAGLRVEVWARTPANGKAATNPPANST